jgi:hypothetical protein
MSETREAYITNQSRITEADVKRDIINHLWLLGWLVLRPNQGAITSAEDGPRRHLKFCVWYAPGLGPLSAGVSDILAIEPGTGRLWAIETKRPGKRGNVSKLQRTFLAAVEAVGGVALVADSVEMLIEEIERRKL